MLPEAIAAMTEELAQLGNPSSLHNAGRRARRVVEESREQLAEVFGARASEVIFTSGGTEADNLAVKGLFWARRSSDERRLRVLTTAVEHHAVFDSVRWLCDAHGACADWLTVDPLGLVSPDVLRAALAADPASAAVVSVMWANNEVGAVQPSRRVWPPWRMSSACRSTPTRCRRRRSCRWTSPPPARTR